MAAGSYDHPQYLGRKYLTPGVVGGAATTTYARTPIPFAAKLRNVSFVVAVAGTATTHKFDIFSGTSSIGAVTLGTSAVGVVGTSGDLASTIASGGNISVKSGADATGTAGVMFEVEMTPDASWT